LALNKKAPRALHIRRNRGQLRGSYKAVPYYNINAQKGGLQLAATIRVLCGPRGRDRKQGPTRRQFRGDTKGRRTAARAAAVTESGRQKRRRPLNKAGAAQQAAVTEAGRLSRRPLHKAGGRLSRRPLQKQGGSAGGRHRKRAAVTGGRYEYEKRAAVTGGRYRNIALGQDAPTTIISYGR
jgi:hypothetical protein